MHASNAARETLELLKVCYPYPGFPPLGWPALSGLKGPEEITRVPILINDVKSLRFY